MSVVGIGAHIKGRSKSAEDNSCSSTDLVGTQGSLTSHGVLSDRLAISATVNWDNTCIAVASMDNSRHPPSAISSG